MRSLCGTPFRSLMHSPPSSDIEELTCQPVGLLGSQENNDVGDIFRLADATERDACGNAGFCLGRKYPVWIGPGGNDIHGDAVLSHFNGRRAAVGFNGMFAGGIADVLFVGMCRIGAEIDDSADCGFPFKYRWKYSFIRSA